ncbi:MAG: Alcohol dehydrogenase GroES domain protein [Myxococcales bacterium]|nr:Alcohol dehydrogenase GroES domain protein [Myxococcales bacterium]
MSAKREPSENTTQPSPKERELVVLLTRFGGPDAFELLEQPVPTAGSGEVRVRVMAASVQFTDVILRKGRYLSLHQSPPLVLGYDVVGEIDEVGPDVMGFRVGERVADLTVIGSYARYRTLRAAGLVHVPPDVDPAEAVALVLTWTTAYQLLHRQARVRRGQKVLVLGAAGAVGQALVTLGRLAGLEVWGTARAEHMDLIRSLGATPFDLENPSEQALASRGFDVVFDGIGEHGCVKSWARVKSGGTLSAFGFSAAIEDEAKFFTLGLWLLRLHLWDWLPNGKTATFFSITALRKRHPEWYLADLEGLLALLSKGVIHPRIAERIGLEDVPEAHRRLEAGGLTGKIVVCPSPERRSPREAEWATDIHTARGFGTLESDRAGRDTR